MLEGFFGNSKEKHHFAEEKALGVTPLLEDDSRPMTQAEIKSATRKIEEMREGGAKKTRQGEIIATDEQIEKARTEMEEDGFKKQLTVMDTNILKQVAFTMQIGLERNKEFLRGDMEIDPELAARIYDMINSELKSRGKTQTSGM
jgi:hypothetical protein